MSELKNKFGITAVAMMFYRSYQHNDAKLSTSLSPTPFIALPKCYTGSEIILTTKRYRLY